jgi:uncharacterized damage-inducible protein DinB
MYRNIEDFIADWKSEEEFTIKIFSSIPEDVKSSKVNDNIRSLERLAWHISQTLTEMPYKAGIIAQDYLEDEPIPANMKEIILIYKKYSGELMNLVAQKWKDEDLTAKVEMYGQQWERRKILSVLVLHQVHHRAQMTTIMRLLHVPVPGIYGPSKEEWSAIGMEPME